MKRMWKWEKTITRASVSRWWAGFLLILAIIHLVLTLVGAAQGREVEANLLWVLGLTAASVALRNSVRVDELRAEHAESIRQAKVEAAAAHHRLNEMDQRLSTVVVRREAP